MAKDLYKSTVRLPSDSVRGTIDEPGFLVARSDSGDDAIRLDCRIMIIGADDTAEVRIDGDGVGAYHAELTYDDGRYTVAHCDGSEPVKVNGKVVTRHTLSDGDVVAIGEHWFTFKHHGGSTPNAR